MNRVNRVSRASRVSEEGEQGEVGEPWKEYKELSSHFLEVSITYTLRFSASFHRPSRLYTNATMPILLIVSSCS